MASKYDSYWAGRLEEIHAALERAASGFAVVVGLLGLRSAGERGSWYGVAEVCGREVTYDSMAHATSLGKLVAASGVCVTWPGFTFRFTVGAAGDVLIVSAAEGGAVQPAVTARHEEQAGARSPAGACGAHHLSSVTGGALPGAGRVSVPDGTAAGRFYRALGQLADAEAHQGRLLEPC